MLFFFTFHGVSAEYIFKPGSTPSQTSLIQYASIADAGGRELSIQEVRNKPNILQFSAFKGINGNLGFTNRTYWVKFELQNQSGRPLFYYLETAEPVTDNVNFYLFDESNSFTTQMSGDNLSFAERSVAFRKTIFKIQLEPGEKKQAFLEVKNDGEKNNLPLNLISPERFLEITYHDQLVMGIFYGILFIIAITYLFFYFALDERIFLYYSLYVACVGLCQFALDGFFHQYIDRSNSWINLHAVIIFAIAAAYLFGKYSELVLNIKQNSKSVYIGFKVLYILLGIVLSGIVLFPSFLKISYPAVNILTLVGMLLIVLSIIVLFVKKQPLDLFYTAGIAILFICFSLAILLNFGLITSFSIENITKPGIGLEIIALSLSMANRIRVLKSKKEELQTIALQKSQEMNDVKSFFLSNMSHELRTPLNAILGLTNSMESEIADEKIKATCDEIKDAAFSLISSVNDIMDFSKIEKGQIRLDRVIFSPFSILEKARLNYQKQATKKGLEFNYSTNLKQAIRVLGDPNRLEQMVNNVLSNALKFTSSGFISLDAKSVETEGHLDLVLTIRDTGIGIAPEKLASVFEMFSQVDISDRRRYGGFGIGLCIVNSLVNLHGGAIKLTSIENRGTDCSISLKYFMPAEEVKPVNKFPEESYDLLGTHVLVVEDNPMNQMVIKMMMKKWSNTTLTFSNNGAESLEALKNIDVDIILMDLQMPVMDGYQATAAIRNGDAGTVNNAIPIIVITADVMESTRDRILSMGANDWMTKPVDQKLLYQKITNLLSVT